MIAVAVLFVTSEYRRGMIRTTFLATPRRGRVLAAKAVVIGAAAFVVGLVSSVAAFLVAPPILRDNGFAPPHFPVPELSDPVVLRAVLGTAAVFALFALLALGLGAALRHSAGPITVLVLVLLLPQLVAGALPLGVARWVTQLSPSAGFAIQQTVPRYEQAPRVCLPEAGCYVDGPWPGLLVLAGYAALALALAAWLLRRRDA